MFFVYVPGLQAYLLYKVHRPTYIQYLILLSLCPQTFSLMRFPHRTEMKQYDIHNNIYNSIDENHFHELNNIYLGQFFFQKND